VPGKHYTDAGISRVGRACRPAQLCRVVSRPDRWPDWAEATIADHPFFGDLRLIHTDGRDWLADFRHENGYYQNRCRACDKPFFGHKRRVVCRHCSVGEPEQTRTETTAQGKEKRW